MISINIDDCALVIHHRRTTNKALITLKPILLSGKKSRQNGGIYELL